ncbi:FMN-linked oxidoreductase [Bimuria novae-zelandiae CBS 107.79]|uniref:FMN-linked oxidoreductase n=1 Tax=Bimuria novae-zelandiae CBS 107.79 TaxID=1447943 RepID=A0A6A5VFF9_9PLEO|nr:FMN-linked oxidoreductase [Bimuria novae-zelandiae CBS 107.79]
MSTRESSVLFSPLRIANGKIELSHRVVLAPLTRNRCLPLEKDEPEAGKYNRIWVPDELVAEYYAQRTTEGGLLISEGIAPSLESNGMSGVPGLFHPAQLEGWKIITSAVHAKGGYIYAQLWHAGRTTSEPFTGKPAVAPSVVPMEGDSGRIPPGYDTPVMYIDHPPIELSHAHIKATIEGYCSAAKMAMQAGFDGVEVHGGNGYLPEQFLLSNINQRTDEYGGSPEKRCRFIIELMESLADAVGEENCAIRLSPFGLFNQARGEQRIETWSFLCKQLKEKIPNMSYISLIEPRYEQIHSYSEKDQYLSSQGLDPSTINLKFLREIMGDTPFFSAGGWNDTNSWGLIESGEYDALLYGRYFTSTPDLVERLRLGKAFTKYERDRFYGPFPDRERGYTDYPVWQEQGQEKSGGVTEKGDTHLTVSEVKVAA